MQHLVMWARQEEECQKFRKVVKYMSGRKERRASGYDGTKAEFVERSTGRSSKADYSRHQGAGRKIVKRGNGAFGEQNL